jgi:hypothetical protein
MEQKKTHLNCKYFSYRKCPHINDEIMKLATQNIPETKTGSPTWLNFPATEEVDKICSDCDSFTMK